MLCDDLEGWDRRVGGRFKREGIYEYLWVIHFAAWQKPTQYCKAFLQFKKKKSHFYVQTMSIWTPTLKT